MTPCRPSGAVAPSVTSRRCGAASCAAGSRAVRPAGEAATIRPWGSHLTQSQWARFRSDASTATARCSGEWNVAAEQISDRARARAGSGAPQISTRVKARRSIEAGRPAWRRWTTSSRCRAAAATGSTWSSRRGLRRDQLERQRLGAHAVPDVQEARVGRGALPDARALGRDARERRGLGMPPAERAALPAGRLADQRAHVREVVEVRRPRPVLLLGALPALPVQLRHEEPEAGDEEQARREVAAAALLPARAGDQHDRAEAAEHRDRVHQEAAGRVVRLDPGWRLEHELPRGEVGLVEPAAVQRCAQGNLPTSRLARC